MSDALTRTERLEQAHAYRLQRLGRLLRYQLLQVLQPYHLTPEQYVILFRLREEDGRTQRDLVDPAFDDRANITHLVNQLQKAGLVVREQDEADRRRRIVRMTDAGRERLEAVLDVAIGVRGELFGDFSEAELAQLMRFVERLERRLLDR